MPTNQPRLNVVLENSVYQGIQRLSKKRGVSMSLMARDLLREALETHEDAFWAMEAEERERTLTKKPLKHGDVWEG